MRGKHEAGLWGVAVCGMLMAVTCAAEAAPIVVDFEDLAVGTRFGCRDTFTSGGVMFFPDLITPGGGRSGGCETGGGGTFIISIGEDTDVRNALSFFRLNLSFDFGSDLSGMTITLLDRGNDVRFRINDEASPFETLPSFDEQTIGDVTISEQALGGDLVRLSFQGNIHQFVIGSFLSILTIDDITAVPVPEPGAGLMLLVITSLLTRTRRY